MALILWYEADGPRVRKVSREYLMGDGFEIRHHESMHFPQCSEDDLVVIMGDRIKKLLEVNGLIKKNRTISSLREQVIVTPKMKFMITYALSIADIDYSRGVEVLCDLQMAKRYSLTGQLAPKPGHYTCPPDLDKFCKEVEALYESSGKPVPVAIDLETMGVNPYDPAKHILDISLSHAETTAIVISFGPYTQPKPPAENTPESLSGWHFLSQLDWLLNTPKVSTRGANLKFDLIWIAEKWGIHCTNFKFDTLLVGSLLDENRSNSLKIHAKVLTSFGGYSDEFDKKYDKAHMEVIPIHERVVYAAQDADATMRVAKVEQELLLQQPSLARFYVRVLHPAARAFEKVERCGVLVDLDAYQKVQSDLEQELVLLEDKALKCVNRRLRIKWGTEAKLTKAKFLADFMFSTMGLNLAPRMYTKKTGVPSTSMDHFEMFDDDERSRPFVKALKEYNSASKTLSTFVVGFLKHLRPDGRFHPTYYLANQGDLGGTVTGRLSARDPAIQTLIKHSKWAKILRKCFIAPPGMVMLGPDYSQGELKIAACFSGEPTMLKSYQQGIDLHAVTASGLAGWELEEFMALKEADPDKYDAIRQLGKCYSGDTEVLTRGGWIRFDALPRGVEVMQYNQGALEYVVPLAYQQYEQKVLWELTDRHTHLCVTPDHNQPTIDRYGNLFIDEIQNYPEWRLTGSYAIHSGEYRREETLSPEWTRFYVMLQADGHYEKDGSISFGFKKERKINRCIKLLQDLKLYYHRYQTPSLTRIKIPSYEVRGYSLKDVLPDKHFTWEFAHHCNAEALLEEVRWWDGKADLVGRNLVRYSSSLELNVDVVQFVAVTTTRICTKRVESKEGHPAQYHLSFRGEKRSASRTTWRPKPIAQPGTSLVYCVTVPSHMILVRKCGKVTVSSNCGNFGLLYGMGAGGFQTYAKLTYGVDMTLEEATAARDRFFETYPVLLEWHKFCKHHARINKEISSPLGRVRHLPLINSPVREVAAKAERQAINSPVQSTLSDMSLWATAIMDQEFGMTKDGYCVIGMVHDQLLAYAPEDEADLWAARMKDVMENLPFEKVGWQPQLQFTADMSVGYNLAELKKWQTAGDFIPAS